MTFDDLKIVHCVHLFGGRVSELLILILSRFWKSTGRDVIAHVFFPKKYGMEYSIEHPLVKPVGCKHVVLVVGKLIVKYL